MDGHPRTSTGLVEEGRRSLQEVRRSLIELYASVGVDPGQPQAVAKRLGLNRNLTWKLSRVISANDPFASLNHLPGQQGLELAARAFRDAGAPAEALTGVENAVREFMDTVAEHADDREQFELTLESMGLFERELGMESGRELAWRGTSMIWGVQARTRLTLTVVGPSALGPDKVDFVQAAGLIGFRRLREQARWRLLRLRTNDDRGGDLIPGTPEPLGDAGDSEVSWIIRDLCSPNMPRLEVEHSPFGREVILPGGPVGNQSTFDTYFGHVVRGLSRYRTPDNEHGSTASSLTIPLEMLVMDLLVHRSVPITRTPEFAVYGFPHGGPEDPSAQTTRNLLPMAAAPVELAGMPPAVATARVSKYGALLAKVWAKTGWDPSDFWGVRVTLPFPPMSALAVLRWPLPEAR
ncbi:MAG: hypothetical protein SFY69_00345 [Planctomycetota bacterium]|nr:hypothetical protein [Planctomycetota bacterium]